MATNRDGRALAAPRRIDPGVPAVYHGAQLSDQGSDDPGRKRLHARGMAGPTSLGF
jgi:hypothetical protein